MKIQGDAAESARNGYPVYSVSEDDRKRTWSLSEQLLSEMAPWDELSTVEKHNRLGAVLRRRKCIDPPIDKYDNVDQILEANVSDTGHWSGWLDEHAVVARGSLRNFLDWQ